MRAGELAQNGVESGLKYVNEYMQQFDDMLPQGYRLQKLRQKAMRSLNPSIRAVSMMQQKEM